MAEVRVEFVPIARFYLGTFGLDHMQLVYQPGEFAAMSNQDNWYVLEGLFLTTALGKFLGVEGANGTTRLPAANGGLSGFELELVIGTPSSRGSRILPINTSAIEAFRLMAQFGGQIADNAFPYIGYGPPYTPFPTFNSSSVISSLAWEVGVDINVNLPYGIRFSPGTSTLLGTRGDDVLTMPENSFDTLAGGYGNDEFNASNSTYRVDKLFGGAGNDIFHWSSGFNIINGGEPTLSQSEDGEDTVDYIGAGTIHIKGNRELIPGLSRY